MTKIRWQKMQELFNSALELSDESREKFLNDSCNGDAELFRQVEELLKIDYQGNSVSNCSDWFAELFLNAKMDGNLVPTQRN